MKKILYFTTLYITIPILGLLLICSLVWYCHTKTTNLTVERDKTTLMFGSSLTQCGINDTILSNCCNYGRLGVNLFLSKEFIESMISQNPQIDTVFIEFSLGNICSRQLTLETETSKFSFSYYYSVQDLIAYKNLKVLSQYSFYDNVSIFLSVEGCIRTPENYGFYAMKENNINNGKTWSIQWHDSVFASQDTVILKYDEVLIKNEKELSTLHELIDYCKNKNKLVVLFNPPSYHIERWYDPSYYYIFVKSLENKVLVADYMNFSFPDLSYYGDAKHLNYKGAYYFCSYIKENGWHLETTAEYYNRKTKTNP